MKRRIVGDPSPSTYVTRGTWEGAIPLSADPNASATGVYTDENLVNWMVAPSLADNQALDQLVQVVADHAWKAWIDGDDGKAVYGLPDSGSEAVPLLSAMTSSLDAVKAIDAWIVAHGKANPNFAANKVLVQRPSGGKGELTVVGSFSWWPLIIACVAIYYVSKSDSGGKRRRKRR